MEQIIVDTIERASARALYQAAEAEDGDYESWHFDRQEHPLSLDVAILPQMGFPINLLIEHPGHASVQANAFENMRASATPYEEVHRHYQASWRMA